MSSNQENKNHKKPTRSLSLKILTTLIILALSVSAMLAIAVISIYPKLPSMDELRNYQPKLPLQVYSKDGVLLGQFGEEHRVYIKFEETPPQLIKAIIAAEDERFFEHKGIDFIGVIRAIFNNIITMRRHSGASTITMQVARNFFLTTKKTYTRKFHEALLSYKIENSLTKNQILELYINQIFLGERAYGFAEAALTYFGKPIDKLTVAEYAILAGLPKAPSAYNPVVNMKRSRERQHYILDRMHSLGFIDDKTYRDAYNEPINIVKGSLKDATDSGGYIAEMVRQMLFDKYGDSIYTKGYKVYTTIDSRLQQVGYKSLRETLLNYDITHGYNGSEKQIEINDENNNDEINDQDLIANFDTISDVGDLQAAIVIKAHKNYLNVKLRNGTNVELKGADLALANKYINANIKGKIVRGSVIRVRNVNGKWVISQIPTVEGALVAIDPQTGAISTLVGGFDFTKNNYNHVTQALRQPGSGFKPFIYSAALEKGFMPDSIIEDSEVCYPTGGVDNKEWCPKNDARDFLGPITLRQALTKSVNVVTVKLLDQITPQYAIDYISKFGFDTSNYKPYLTLALGANEVTPLQMARGFAVFANGGYLVTPYLVDKITDSRGNLIAQTQVTDIHSTTPVIDPRNAFIINSILQDVARYGTGARAYAELRRSDIAGKTGTTNDAKDVWFNGYTPSLVAIDWIGYDSPKSLGTRAYGANLALPLWINFMKEALKGKPEMALPMSKGIIVKPNASWKGTDEYIYDDASSSIKNIISSPKESTAISTPTSNIVESGTIKSPESISVASSESMQNTTSQSLKPALPIANESKVASTLVAPKRSESVPDLDQLLKDIKQK